MEKIRKKLSATGREEIVGKREHVAKRREEIVGKREHVATGREEIVGKRERIKKGENREGIALEREEIVGKRETVATGREEIVGKREHVAKRREETDERYKVLFTFSKDAIMTLEPPNWKFTSGNDSAIKIFNVKDEKEFISLGPVDLSPEKQPDGQLSSIKAKKMIEKAMKEGSSFFEWTHMRYGDGDFPATVLLSRVEEEGRIYLQATVRDITAQKRAEKDLEKSEEKLKMIADNISDVLLSYDMAHHLVYANSAIERLTGYTLSEIMDFKPNDNRLMIYINPDDNKKITAKWNECISKRDLKTSTSEFRILTKNKETKWISASYGSVYDESKKQTGVYVVYHDITQRKEAEEKIKKQVEQLKELDIAKTDFMNIVSHELKTPLTAIYANLELLEEIKTKLSEKNINNLNALRRNSNQLRFLVDNILEIARIQSNKFELNISKIDLENCISSIVNDLKILSDKKNIKLIVEIDKPINMSTDSIRLTEILNNLIDNAIKFTEEGYVKIKAIKQDDSVLVEVTDTGIGIPEDKISKLFEKFYQIYTPLKSEVGGTGLGLAITKQLVELLGGKINLKSELGKGSTFYFTLPIRYKEEVKK
ncbi:MAG TPA: ATP-binding protein [Candidatus Nanoarchaeia archaeon]|nr:ATP-binding protein [Candidatus Nanoarchaeia archaeon]